MTLHDDKKTFRQAIQATADRLKIPAVFIEKDYWVCYALHTIFSDPIGKDVVFKGGTALSKCYKMIDRFSEDIDLVVLRREGETDSQLKNKLKKISTTIEGALPEVTIEEVTRKMGMNRKTAHSYSKEYDESYGQVRDVIILESSWLGYYEPYTSKTISSMITDMMVETGQSAMVKKFGLQPFVVKVLEPTRTICEKIMSLVRFSYSENPIDDLKRKIRHVYDLHQLLQQEEFSTFFDSTDLDTMLLKVGNDDVVSFKNSNQWLNNHPLDALIFRELDSLWPELKQVYNGEFRNLTYGTFPSDDDVLATLKRVQERLKLVKWTVTANKNQE